MYLSAACRILEGMERWRLGHRPALDGLRGVAIVLVLLAHFDNPTANPFTGAGATGVSVFFTLSGFLITSLLLEEREKTGRISLRGFYLRRAARLMPALWAMVAVVVVLQLTIQPMGASTGLVVAVLASVSNIWQNSHEFGHALGHTWSLSIEEQFYLIWPAALIFAAHKGRRAIVAVAVAGIGCSLVALAIPGGSDDRGSIEQAGALMAGCLLAVLMSGRPEPVRRTYWPTLAALAGLAPLIWMHDVLPLWVYTVTPPVLTTVALWNLASGRGPRWLSGPVLRWFGKRSYGIYLWHYPIVYFVAGGGGAAIAWQPLQVVRIVLALAVAELSWRLIEQPAQRWMRRSRNARHAPKELVGNRTVHRAAAAEG